MWEPFRMVQQPSLPNANGGPKAAVVTRAGPQADQAACWIADNIQP